MMSEVLSKVEGLVLEYKNVKGEARRTTIRTDLAKTVDLLLESYDRQEMLESEFVLIALAMCKRYETLRNYLNAFSAQKYSSETLVSVANYTYRGDLSLARKVVDFIPNQVSAKKGIVNKLEDHGSTLLNMSRPELLELFESNVSLLEKVEKIFGSMPTNFKNCSSEVVYPEKMQSASYIYVNGIGWSGSGAVHDFLSDFEGFESFYDGEFIWMTKELSLFLKESSCVSFEKLVLAMLLGSEFIRNDYSVSGQVQVPRTSFLRCFMERYPNFLGYLKNCLCRFIRATEEKCYHASTFGPFLSDVLAVGPDSPYVLINNSLKSQEILNSAVFPRNSWFICVHRDFRDQFFELYYDQRVESVDGFSMRARFFEKFKNSYKKLASDRIVSVYFDDFVQSSAIRKGLLVRLGVDSPTYKLGEKKFKPEESIKNVGRYKEFHDQRMIDELEEAFSSSFTPVS